MNGTYWFGTKICLRNFNLKCAGEKQLGNLNSGLGDYINVDFKKSMWRCEPQLTH